MRDLKLVMMCLLNFVIVKHASHRVRKYHLKQVYLKNCKISLLPRPRIMKIVYRLYPTS